MFPIPLKYTETKYTKWFTFWDGQIGANSADPDQTALSGAV